MLKWCGHQEKIGWTKRRTFFKINLQLPSFTVTQKKKQFHRLFLDYTSHKRGHHRTIEPTHHCIMFKVTVITKLRKAKVTTGCHEHTIHDIPCSSTWTLSLFLNNNSILPPGQPTNLLIDHFTKLEEKKVWLNFEIKKPKHVQNFIRNIIQVISTPKKKYQYQHTNWEIKQWQFFLEFLLITKIKKLAYFCFVCHHKKEKKCFAPKRKYINLMMMRLYWSYLWQRYLYFHNIYASLHLYIICCLHGTKKNWNRLLNVFLFLFKPRWIVVNSILFYSIQNKCFFLSFCVYVSLSPIHRIHIREYAVNFDFLFVSLISSVIVLIDYSVNPLNWVQTTTLL